MTGTEGFIYGATTVIVLDLVGAFVMGFARGLARRFRNKT